jgi:cupin 2 domain-containing protein
MSPSRPNAGNLFDDLSQHSHDEQFIDLFSGPGIRIERIVSTGQASPPDSWCDQAWTEWVLVVSGAAAILFEGEAEPRRLRAGDYLLIPAHRRHRVAWTDRDVPTIWLAVHIGEPAASAIPSARQPNSGRASGFPD